MKVFSSSNTLKLGLFNASLEKAYKKNKSMPLKQKIGKNTV